MIVGLVLLPYEITLLSNLFRVFLPFLFVLLPYEITLLSNKTHLDFETEEFYYLMKLHYSQTGFY